MTRRDGPRRFVPALAWAAVLAGAGGCRVGFVGMDEAAQARKTHAHAHGGGSGDLGDEGSVKEPDKPAAGTDAERALAHVHAGKQTCSGLLLSPKIVLTAHRCLGGLSEKGGARVLDEAERKDAHVEVGSADGKFVDRAVVGFAAPACAFQTADVALLVLGEPVGWLKPLAVAATPDSAASVTVVGYGACPGAPQVSRAGTITARDDDDVTVRAPACRGDVGGVVLDASGRGVIAVVSHGESEGPDQGARQVAAARLDTRVARRLLKRGTEIESGSDLSSLRPVPCE